LEDRRLDDFKPTVFVGFAKRAGELLFTGFGIGLFNMRGDALPAMALRPIAFDSGVWRLLTGVLEKIPRTRQRIFCFSSFKENLAIYTYSIYRIYLYQMNL
jgi:hypothetical protein